jgi:hypothetical protein
VDRSWVVTGTARSARMGLLEDWSVVEEWFAADPPFSTIMRMKIKMTIIKSSGQNHARPIFGRHFRNVTCQTSQQRK